VRPEVHFSPVAASSAAGFLFNILLECGELRAQSLVLLGHARFTLTAIRQGLALLQSRRGHSRQGQDRNCWPQRPRCATAKLHQEKGRRFG